MHSSLRKSGSRLDRIENRAVGGKAGREQRAAEAATSVHRDRQRRFRKTAAIRVVAANDAPVGAERPVDRRKAAAGPPEAVRLGRERPGRIDTCIDERSEEPTSELPSL